MNTVVTSKEDILEASRELIRRQGWAAVNIRSVAAACGVSVGSIYNYFGSKAELAGAAVESVWQEIFDCPAGGDAFRDTCACVSWMYSRMEYGGRRYPGFFTLHSLGFLQQDRPEGRRRMHRAWQHILDGLRAVLERDPQVRPGAFGPAFTPETFAQILFDLMLSALVRGDYDPAPALEIVRRTLY
ncbi:MAG: TetR/AcrR family transcriptional regulator [Blautia massiliensis (ex Durand et al. 2017)]